MRILAALATLGLLTAACGTTTLSIEPDTYRALVPTAEQQEADVAGELPGGFMPLLDDGVGQIEIAIQAEEVEFRIDGVVAITRLITDRVAITDSEGSGPFKANKEVLVLGDEPLALGTLTIEVPVIWPGSFEESPVITLKSFSQDERGPAISCTASEACLLLSSATDPVGTYEDANDPTLKENPVSTIEVSSDFVEFTLDDGEMLRVLAADTSVVRACGLAETQLWNVPSEIGLTLVDPVLVHTLCPSTPGAAIQLIIMERAEIPVLAPLAEMTDGNWCSAAPTCLWFAPTS